MNAQILPKLPRTIVTMLQVHEMERRNAKLEQENAELRTEYTKVSLCSMIH